MPDSEKPQDKVTGDSAGLSDNAAASAGEPDSALDDVGSKQRSPGPVVACAACGAVGPARKRLNGNRSRYGLVLIGGSLAAVGLVALLVATLTQPVSSYYESPSILTVVARVAAAVLIPPGAILLLVRMLHTVIDVCGTCGNQLTVPVDSPRGRELAEKHGEDFAAAASANARNRRWPKKAAIVATSVAFLAGAAAGGIALGYDRGRETGWYEGNADALGYPRSSTHGSSPVVQHPLNCTANPDLKGTAYPGAKGNDCITSAGGLVTYTDVTVTVTSLDRVVATDGTRELCASIKVATGARSYTYSWDNWQLQDPLGASRWPENYSGGRVSLLPNSHTAQRYCFVDARVGGMYLVIDPPPSGPVASLRTIWVFNLPPA